MSVEPIFLRVLVQAGDVGCIELAYLMHLPRREGPGRPQGACCHTSGNGDAWQQCGARHAVAISVRAPPHLPVALARPAPTMPPQPSWALTGACCPRPAPCPTPIARLSHARTTSPHPVTARAQSARPCRAERLPRVRRSRGDCAATAADDGRRLPTTPRTTRPRWAWPGRCQGAAQAARAARPGRNPPAQPGSCAAGEYTCRVGLCGPLCVGSFERVVASCVRACTLCVGRQGCETGPWSAVVR